MKYLKEIGSEFESNLVSDIENNLSTILPHQKYFLSGRTALATIIDDICSSINIRSVYLPSYCCETMIIPFIRKGIAVKFFTIKISDNNSFEVEYDYNHGCDVVLLMHYFGYYQEAIEQIIANESKAIIIQDITHSVFNNKGISAKADYWFCSFRKWCGIAGLAIAGKKSDWDIEILNRDSNREFVSLRNKAREIKKRYVAGECVQKNTFLSLYSEAESKLDVDYENYGCDNQSREIFNYLDIVSIRKKRITNALFLHQSLHSINGISLLFDLNPRIDCPLFVPVICYGNRDSIKENLVANQIYVPVHWPLSDSHILEPQIKSLFYKELSLICDQRYSIKDMDIQYTVLKTISNNLDNYSD